MKRWPKGASAGRSMMPSWSSDSSNSRSEHSIPFDSTPRITPGFRSTPVPGTCVPTGANTPTRPVRALGAPHTTCTSTLGFSGPSGQVSTRHSRKRSALGCGFASITRQMRNAPRVSAGFTTSSTSWPRSVSAKRISSSEAAVSRWSFNQDRVNFMALPHAKSVKICALALAQSRAKGKTARVTRRV